MERESATVKLLALNEMGRQKEVHTSIDSET